jgi:hypothetical protein
VRVFATRAIIIAALGSVLLAAGWVMVVRDPMTLGPMAAPMQAVAQAPVEAGTSNHAVSREPELPRIFMNTSYVAAGGRTILVAAGDNLQNAIDDARPRDTIRLQAGATFTGNFRLPDKGNEPGWIVIRTETPDDRFVPRGTRVTPADAPKLARILSDNSAPAISADDGAHHYQLLGLEIGVTDEVQANANVVRLGDGRQNSPDRLPNQIIIDRCYIHGNSRGNIRRGVTLNGASLALIDSYVENIHEAQADSQAVGGWNGPGPFKIVNNFLEGAGENLMFGGARPAVHGLIPSDIEIRRNHFFKRLSWWPRDPSFAGIRWQVKNLLELKNGRRLLIEGNVFENVWTDAQAGFAILLKTSTEAGWAPWAATTDITFRYNIIRHASNGINISGRFGADPQVRLERLKIHDNLLLDIDGPKWGNPSQGRLFQILQGPANVTIERNLGLQTSMFLVLDGRPKATGFIFRNNIVPHNDQGAKGSGARTGTPSLEKFLEGYTFSGNVIVGGVCSLYPGGNSCPRDWNKVGFARFNRGDFRLTPQSPYKGRGPDLSAIEKETAGVVVRPPTR